MMGKRGLEILYTPCLYFFYVLTLFCPILFALRGAGGKLWKRRQNMAIGGGKP